jgi:hypothetical protein
MSLVSSGIVSMLLPIASVLKTLLLLFELVLAKSSIVIPSSLLLESENSSLQFAAPIKDVAVCDLMTVGDVSCFSYDETALRSPEKALPLLF